MYKICTLDRIIFYALIPAKLYYNFTDFKTTHSSCGDGFHTFRSPKILVCVGIAHFGYCIREECCENVRLFELTLYGEGYISRILCQITHKSKEKQITLCMYVRNDSFRICGSIARTQRKN